MDSLPTTFSKLNKEMLFSEGYRDHITHQGKPDPFVEPEYGYISPPEFNHPRVHSYDELVDTYRSIRNAENRDELSMEQIVEDLPFLARNSLIRQIYNKYDSYDGDIDVARLLFDKYGQMTYSQLLQNFPERIFVNLEPEIHRGEFHVHISDLFS
jgi:hypothetical protein